MSETTIRSVSPVLASMNKDETQKFYQEKMGFETTSKYGAEYLIIARSQITLHFTICDDKYIAENTSCYIYVENIEPLYAEYKARGVLRPHDVLRDTYYGLREFAVIDGDGNLLKFGEKVVV